MSVDPSHDVRRHRITWSAALLPILLVAVVSVFAVLTIRSDDAGVSGSDSGDAGVAVDIAATGPRFESLDELVEAADLVVEGRIVSVDVGRTITDPADPAAGFSTALFQLDVTNSLRGPAFDTVIVEQEAALLDGTPITVNGLTANMVGDTGFWFLVFGSR